MRLSESRSGDVVRNVGNDNFYRYERPAEDRARIRPLELFPNGLLIAKPTDTIVSADIVVEKIGVWSDGLVISGVRGRGREVYERERQRLQAQLDVLEGEQLTIEPKHRGSFANRLKAVRQRLEALNLGLEDLGTEPIELEITKLQLPNLKLKQVVVMPSGRPAQFLGFLPQHDQLLATVVCSVSGQSQLLQVDPEALRPMSQCHMATV